MGFPIDLHNINAAAIAGALVVFDEFHLMEPHRAFLTAAAGLHLFRGAVSVSLDDRYRDPAPRGTGQRCRGRGARPRKRGGVEGTSGLAAERDAGDSFTRLRKGAAVCRCRPTHHQHRSIVLLNTVGRSQEMFVALQQLLQAQNSSIEVMLLHSKFFKEDRRRKEERLRTLFGRGSSGQAILVATQVVEAGLDISCEQLHTELCPMNALVQRSGRCARFEGETGTVHVYPLPSEERAWLPYGDAREEDGTLTAHASC